jgi:hypothetical protein
LNATKSSVLIDCGSILLFELAKEFVARYVKKITTKNFNKNARYL